MPVVNPGASVTPFTPGATAPCGWTLDTSCCEAWASYSNTVRDRATSWATYILWGLTGRRFGTCEVTVRPCGTGCNFYGGYIYYPVTADGYGTQLNPYIGPGGQWFNCACTAGCRCTARCQVWLPGPVASVTEVIVNGVVIDPSRYRIDNKDRLVGLDGQCWPECQDLNVESPAADTFQVTYVRGVPLPVAGQIAAGILACEFAKACAGTACSLPQNLASLTRQGIEVSTIDPTDVLQAGLTGLPDVDLFIRTVNPNQLQARPRVWSPDMHYPVQRTF